MGNKIAFTRNVICTRNFTRNERRQERLSFNVVFNNLSFTAIPDLQTFGFFNVCMSKLLSKRYKENSELLAKRASQKRSFMKLFP